MRQEQKSWTVLDDKGNEYTGLTDKDSNHSSPHCIFSTPEGQRVEFYGNFQVFEE